MYEQIENYKEIATIIDVHSRAIARTQDNVHFDHQSQLHGHNGLQIYVRMLTIPFPLALGNPTIKKYQLIFNNYYSQLLLVNLL